MTSTTRSTGGTIVTSTTKYNGGTIVTSTTRANGGTIVASTIIRYCCPKLSYDAQMPSVKRSGEYNTANSRKQQSDFFD